MHRIDELGVVVSILISWVLTASALPALSTARYLTVVVLETVNGPLEAVPVVALGVLPSVV